MKRRAAIIAATLAVSTATGAAVAPAFAGAAAPSVIVSARDAAPVGCLVFPLLQIAICIPG